MAVSSGDVDDTILEQLPPKKHLFTPMLLTLVIGAPHCHYKLEFCTQTLGRHGFQASTDFNFSFNFIVTILLIYGIDIFTD